MKDPQDELAALLAAGLFKPPEGWLDDPDLIEAVKKMPPRRQAVAYLRFSKGLTQAECAAALSVNQQSVSRHERIVLETTRAAKKRQLTHTSGKLRGSKD